MNHGANSACKQSVFKKGFARDKDAFIQQKKTITGQSFPYVTNVLYMKIIYIYKLSNFEKL